MTKRLTEILLLGAFLAMSLGLYRSTAAFPDMVQGSTATYIRFLALSIGLLCLLEVGLWIRKGTREEGKKLNMTAAPFRFWSLLVLMLVYSMLLEYLGFYLTSILFLPVTMFMLGARSAFSIGLTSGGVLLFIFIVFGKILGVPLPQGSLF